MRRSRRRPALERGNRALLWLIVGTIAFFLLLKLLSLWAEGLWFASEGYGQVFVRLLWWRGLLFVLCGVWFFALLYVPYRLAQKAAAKVPMPLRPKLFDDMDKALVDATIDRWALWLSLLFATIAGLIASGRWNYLVLFLYGEPFGVTDPVFGKDVGFYISRLPLLKFLASLSALGLFLGLSGLVLRLRYEELLRFEEKTGWKRHPSLPALCWAFWQPSF